MKQWFLKELIEKQEQLNTDSADLALNFKGIVICHLVLCLFKLIMLLKGKGNERLEASESFQHKC